MSPPRTNPVTPRCLGRFVALIGLHLLLAACTTGVPLAPAPNLYWTTGEHPFDAVPEPWRTTDTTILYATDRIGAPDDEIGVQYGYDRSQSIAVGEATVAIDQDLTWDELVHASITKKRDRDITMSLVQVDERVRLPDSNTTLLVTDDDRYVEPPEFIEANADAEARIHEMLRARLAHTDRKEVFVYVHGYNNTFEDAAIRMATLWHYFGRQGVPLLYSWPAAHPGLLRGYNYDRESSEFTVFHLKQIGRILVSCPEVERVHIVAHSRGTDVTLNMLREFWIEQRAQLFDASGRRKEGAKAPKLGTVILAAGDVDLDVFHQRISAERLIGALDTVVFYLSEDDRAIGLSRWLFGSLDRIGQLTLKHIKPEARAILSRTHRVQLISADVRSDFLGHAYFVTNPAVLSDLVLILVHGALPGAEHGRPLDRENGSTWVIKDNYLVPPKK